LNYARTLHRKLTVEVWGVGHEKAGVSEYDPLVIRRPKESDGCWWVYIEKRIDTINDVELL
jgi:hypothetical protein